MLKEFDISKEEYREYDWAGRIYRINAPVTLYLRTDESGKELGSTHRVLDSTGVVHCIPSVGVMGCALRWKNKDPNKPVNF